MEKQKENILYVDDEQSNLVAFEATFRRNYNVYTACNGAEAIEILRRVPIKVILTDQRMPEMTGVQLLEAIIPDFPRSIRMVVTGFSDIDAIIKSINAGRVFQYISKPWDENELKIVIDKGIHIFNLEDEKQALIEKLQSQLQQQNHIMSLFEKYVPAPVLKEILNTNNSDKSLISGEHRIISVLFFDLRNFTSLAGKIGPLATVELLNDVFVRMTQCVKTNNGSINKYLGDGMMVLFGAPLSSLNNTENAVFCGIEMLNTLHSLNEKYKAKIKQELHIGIGIDTGEVIAGNVGTLDHLEYTVIGDAVNFASRIEDLTRDMPDSLLISETTYQAVKDKVEVDDLGPYTLKGRATPMNLYKVKGKRQ